MADIAVLGTGFMGAAITRRLMATGHRVVVWNRTPAKASGLGAVVAETPASAVRDAEVVIVVLTDAEAVESALFEGGAVTAMRAGATLAQMSTIGPDETRALAARVPPSISYVDAPFAGSVGAAETGTLMIFAAGNGPSLLKDLGTVRDCGPVGAASALKLVVNTAMLTALGALHDTLAVSDGLGVDRAVAIEVLAGGPLSGALQRAGRTDARFALSLAGKDARLALRTVSAEAPVAQATLQLLDAAIDPSADVSALIPLETS
ncbi:NAD(P)-dependent oxidoreductase [Kribbella sp. NPDC055071]